MNRADVMQFAIAVVIVKLFWVLLGFSLKVLFNKNQYKHILSNILSAC